MIHFIKSVVNSIRSISIIDIFVFEFLMHISLIFLLYEVNEIEKGTIGITYAATQNLTCAQNFN